MIGLSQSCYKIYKILQEADEPLTEAEVRERWGSLEVPWTANERKAPLHGELNALVRGGLITKEKQGRRNIYSAANGEGVE